ARLLLRVGRVYVDLGAPHQVRQYAQQALAIVRTLGDQKGEQRALMWLAVSHAQQEAFCQATSYFEQALTMAEEQDDSVASTGILVALGRIHGEVGMFEQALSHLDQARKYNRVSGHPYGQHTAAVETARLGAQRAPRSFDAVTQKRHNWLVDGSHTSN